MSGFGYVSAMDFAIPENYQDEENATAESVQKKQKNFGKNNKIGSI